MTTTIPHRSTISRPLLAEVVHQHLLEGIVSGTFAVGERLNVDALAASFGVSRTPIREALARLAQARLVDVARNASTTVASWGIDDMRDRARLLGTIARVTALDTETTPSAERMLDHGSGPESFVHVMRLMSAWNPRPLLRSVAEELAAPLRLFITPPVLTAHGGRPERMDLGPALGALVGAVEAGERTRIAEVTDELTGAFLEEL